MKTIFEEVKISPKKGALKDVPINYTKKDGTEVHATQTTYNVVIAGKVEKKIVGNKKNGEKLVTIKLAGDSYMDPVYGVPITEDPLFVAFSNNKEKEILSADRVDKMPVTPGGWVIIKGSRVDELDSETGEIRSAYFGQEMGYPTNSRPLHFNYNAYIIAGTLIPKEDGTYSMPLRAWNKALGQNYTYWATLTPANELSEEEKAELLPEKTVDENGFEKNNYKRAAVVIKEELFKREQNANGSFEGLTATFESVTVIPKDLKAAEKSPTVTGATFNRPEAEATETPAAG